MNSDSRESSPDKRRKHKKHRHRSRYSRSRSRSRSPSRSYERPPSTIHINPAFGIHPSTSRPSHPQFGIQIASPPNTHFLEMEVNRLKQQLMAEQNNHHMTQQRMNMMSQEMKFLGEQRNAIERSLYTSQREERKMVDINRELLANTNKLKESIRIMETNQLGSISTIEAKDEEIRILAYQLDVIKQQTDGLNERNSELKIKCEVLVAKNREIQDKIDGSRKVADQSKIDVQKYETDLQCAKVEIQRLMREIEGIREKEELLKSEKRALESAIVKKEDDMRHAGTKATEVLNEANKKIKKLELRLRNEKPLYQAELTTEAIYQTIETIKHTYTSQLNRLSEEIETMKKQKEKDKEEKESAKQVLPDYLQTPHKPKQIVPFDCSNMVMKRPLRPNSGPPVESPLRWQRRNLYDNLEEADDANDRAKRIQSPQVEVKQELEEEEDSFNLSQYDEDDLLADGEAEPFENMELVERQIFGDSL